MYIGVRSLLLLTLCLFLWHNVGNCLPLPGEDDECSFPEELPYNPEEIEDSLPPEYTELPSEPTAPFDIVKRSPGLLRL